MRKKDKASTVERLVHILESADQIEKLLGGMDMHAFDVDERTQGAVERCLGVIGEAAGRLVGRHESFIESHPEIKALLIELREARNSLAHDYYHAPPDVWGTATRRVPGLREQVLDILVEMAPDIAKRFQAEKSQGPDFPS